MKRPASAYINQKQWFAIQKVPMQYIAFFDNYEDAESFRDLKRAEHPDKQFVINEVEGNFSFRIVAYEPVKK